MKIYVAAVEALQNKESSSYQVLDFLGDVLITTHYPDKCDNERDKLYTPKLACFFNSSLLYSISLCLSISAQPFCWVTERLNSVLLVCLERKKEKIDPKFMT